MSTEFTDLKTAVEIAGGVGSYVTNDKGGFYVVITYPYNFYLLKQESGPIHKDTINYRRTVSGSDCGWRPGVATDMMPLPDWWVQEHQLTYTKERRYGWDSE